MIVLSQKVRVSSSKAGTKKSPPHGHGPHKGATEIDVSLWYSEIGLDNNFVVELRESFRGEWLIIGASGTGKIQCLIRGNTSFHLWSAFSGVFSPVALRNRR